MAKQILENQNTDNYRKLKEHIADMYAKEMSGGQWMANGDTIRFDKNGKLIDGQHRLRGIIKSGVPQEFVIVEDIDPEAVKTIDIAHRRSIEDYLKRAEESYENGSTCVVRLVMTLQRRTKQLGQSAGNGAPSPMDVIDEYTKNYVDYNEAVAYAKRVSNESKKVLKPTIVGGIYYYLVHIEGVDRSYVKDFFFKIVNSSRNDRTIYGRTFDALLEMQNGRKAIIETYIRCWNAMVKGRTNTFQRVSTDWFEIPADITVRNNN